MKYFPRDASRYALFSLSPYASRFAKNFVRYENFLRKTHILSIFGDEASPSPTPHEHSERKMNIFRASSIVDAAWTFGKIIFHAG